MLKVIVKFLKALNSNSHPGEIAHAVCLGMLLGFLPKNNIFWFISIPATATGMWQVFNTKYRDE